MESMMTIAFAAAEESAIGNLIEEFGPNDGSGWIGSGDRMSLISPGGPGGPTVGLGLLEFSTFTNTHP